MGATKDVHHVAEDWSVLRDGAIAGVKQHEIPNLVTRNGVMTEVFRASWGLVDAPIEQMIYVALRAGTLSAWHMHRMKTDHLMVVQGAIKTVLYDGRDDSPSHGRIMVFHLSPMRPTLLVVPPGVWHGLQNLEPESSAFVNFFDRSYDHEDPDDWRLEPDCEEIPYRF
ncbi:MAG: dTDP-4-dehydrorhamnose 3,5-epimerase family protein [Solirubrobacteraceae bacterium]